MWVGVLFWSRGFNVCAYTCLEFVFVVGFVVSTKVVFSQDVRCFLCLKFDELYVNFYFCYMCCVFVRGLSYFLVCVAIGDCVFLYLVCLVAS